MRTRGSARFDPYFKVQWYDPASLAWRDVQRQFPTAEDAQAAYLPGQRCRTMRITECGREPVSV